MRLDQISPAIAGLTKTSFNHEAFHLNIHPLDAVFPPHMQIRDYISRGQAAGFFSEDVSSGRITMKDMDHSSASHVYDTTTLMIKMPKGAEPKGHLPQTLSIYKNVETGDYYFGEQKGGVFTKRGFAKNEMEVSQSIVNWAIAFAGQNPCKQSSCQRTFEQIRIHDPVNPFELIKSGWAKLANYMQRVSEDRKPAPPA